MSVLAPLSDTKELAQETADVAMIDDLVMT